MEVLKNAVKTPWEDVSSSNTVIKLIKSSMQKLDRKTDAVLKICDERDQSIYKLDETGESEFWRMYCTALLKFGTLDRNGESILRYSVVTDKDDLNCLHINMFSEMKISDDLEVKKQAIIRSVIYASAKAISEKMVRTSHGKETRVCVVTDVSDIDEPTWCMTRVFFPYCIAKNSVIYEKIFPRIIEILESGNLPLESIFVNPDWQSILNTHEHVYPMHIPCFGSSLSKEESPNDFSEMWFVQSIPNNWDEFDLIEEGIKPLSPDDDEDFRNVATHRCYPSLKQYHDEGERLLFPIMLANAGMGRPLMENKDSTEDDTTTTTVDMETNIRKRSPFAKAVIRHEEEITEKIMQQEASNIVRDDHLKIRLEDIHHEIRRTDDPLQKINENKEWKRIVLKGIERFHHHRKIMGEFLNLIVEREQWQGLTEQYPWIYFSTRGARLCQKCLLNILDHLNPERCQHTSMLNDIACIFRTTCIGEPRDTLTQMKNLFVTFVQEKNPEEYKKRGGREGCYRIFDMQTERATKKRITFWSLLSFLEEDDPLYYGFWYQYVRDYYISRCLEGDMASTNVARAVSIHLFGKYIHSKGSWFRYNSTFWEEHDGTDIHNFLTTEFIQILDSFETRWPEISRTIQTAKSSFTILRNKLSDRSYRMKIYDDVVILLTDSRLYDFSRGNDEEMADIVANETCVLEFSDGEMMPRRGRWEDFQTKAMNCVYENMPLDDPRCVFLQTWVHRMLRNPIKEYQFWKRLASCLRGYNTDKSFDVIWGSGDNGKSLFFDLFLSTFGFGKKAVKIPLDAILEGSTRNASGPSPEIDQARNALVAVMDEPKKGQKFDASRLKAWTGNDTIYARTLHDKGSAFKPTFKTFLIGNTVPKADYDYAMRIRFWIWKIVGRFSWDAPVTEEEQERLGIYPKDKELPGRLPMYKSALLKLLIHYFKLYYKEGVDREPVEQDIQTYWNSTSDIVRFVETNLKDKDGGTVTMDALFSTYRTWIRSQNDKDRPLCRADFEQEMQTMFINQDVVANGGLTGYILKTA